MRPKATFWLAIAPKAALALAIALESSSPREAITVASLLELTTKRSKRRWSELSSPKKVRARLRPGAKYLIGLVGLGTAIDVDAGVALDEVAEAPSAPGAGRC